MSVLLPPSPFPDSWTVELTPTHAPLLQRFFEENPEYFHATTGEPAGPGEGIDEISSQLPEGTPFTKKWVIGYVGKDEALFAMVNVITDLLAVSVFHIGTFIVATSRHGNGQAQVLNCSVEDWAIANGAEWMRLGVVSGNTRAERFWARVGYVPVKERPGIEMGKRIVTVRNMVKPLTGRDMNEYYALIPRDRPSSAD